MVVDLKKRHNITISGSGEKKILFLHGFASSQEAWKWVTPAFEETHTLILIDYVGSGKSDPTAYDEARYQTLDGYVDDLVEVCEELNLDDLIVIGHSVGGTIGLLLAKVQPERIKQVFMLGSSPRYLNDLPDYYGGFERENVDQILEMMELNYSGWASYLASVALPETEGKTQSQYVEASFLSSNPEIAYTFLKVTLLVDYRSVLKEIETDTVILQCSEDSFVPIEAARFMEKELRHTHLHVLSAKGHYPQVSHPDETIAAIKRYLK